MSEYTPITGKLRDAMCQWGWVERDGSIMFTTSPIPSSIDAEQSLAISGSDFDRLCDEIDAIHAQLERENESLKVELDRVLGEQEEHTHARGESITGELREWAEQRKSFHLFDMQLKAIADRIDAEHERQLEVLYRDMSDAEYVKLPKDADGEVWRVGDEIVDDGMVCEVVGIGPNRLYYYVDATDTVEWTQADSRRHHHAPTVEDVLREMLDAWGELPAEATNEAIVAEYAKRLQLAGDAS